MLNSFYVTNVLTAYVSVMTQILPIILAETVNIGDGLKYLGAGVAIVGVIGAGIGQGAIGQGACMAIGRNPEMAPKITSTMIIACGIAESGAIYALVIAILLIFVA
ncbi:F0F1 ATP synthase subunit C [Entomoplasma ellychniae]|uniref:ATP synthase subunit c n=1 Tax=Entomoplasma ellychniae TaxID=2114 RepID=A0A8E2QWC3_9MOLU|nr:ATP synthase F0 subunit C [Entomoplasma ellychniae]PPE04886.1 F0F1 ATP synthase subunit C [Entomoplasma ellychniae]